MWKVAALAVASSPLEGVGGDYIAGAYGDAQEEYFREGVDRGNEAMVAGGETVVFGKGIAVERGIAEPCPVVAPLGLRSRFPCDIFPVYAIVE